MAKGKATLFHGQAVYIRADHLHGVVFFHQLIDAVGQKPRLLRCNALYIAHALTAFSFIPYLLPSVYAALHGGIQILLSLLGPVGFHVFSDSLTTPHLKRQNQGYLPRYELSKVLCKWFGDNAPPRLNRTQRHVDRIRTLPSKASLRCFPSVRFKKRGEYRYKLGKKTQQRFFDMPKSLSIPVFLISCLEVYASTSTPNKSIAQYRIR